VSPSAAGRLPPERQSSGNFQIVGGSGNKSPGTGYRRTERLGKDVVLHFCIVMPKNAEAGGGLMVAVIQLAIALGTTLGGALFDRCGYQSTFVASAAVLLLAALLTFLTSRSPGRPAAGIGPTSGDVL